MQQLLKMYLYRFHTKWNLIQNLWIRHRLKNEQKKRNHFLFYFRPHCRSLWHVSTALNWYKTCISFGFHVFPRTKGPRFSPEDGDPSPLESEEQWLYFSILSLICVCSVSVFCSAFSAARSTPSAWSEAWPVWSLWTSGSLLQHRPHQ